MWLGTLLPLTLPVCVCVAVIFAGWCRLVPAHRLPTG